MSNARNSRVIKGLKWDNHEQIVNTRIIRKIVWIFLRVFATFLQNSCKKKLKVEPRSTNVNDVKNKRKNLSSISISLSLLISFSLNSQFFWINIAISTKNPFWLFSTEYNLITFAVKGFAFVSLCFRF